MLTSGAVMAAPNKHYNQGWHRGGNITPYERVAIARSKANLDALKRRAWADGRLSLYEKVRIRFAENSHNALVARARRS
jgi:hypothetical protein